MEATDIVTTKAIKLPAQETCSVQQHVRCSGGSHELKYPPKTLTTMYKIYLHQAYFFTDFPATTETGISETLSLGKKFLSLAKKSLSKSKILQFDTFAGNSKSPLNRKVQFIKKFEIPTLKFPKP